MPAKTPAKPKNPKKKKVKPIVWAMGVVGVVGMIVLLGGLYYHAKKLNFQPYYLRNISKD